MKNKNNPAYKHGMYGTRPYQIWNQMKNRCSPNYSQKKYYFDKGITVCDEWLTFKGFWDSFKEGYKDCLTIDRINNNEGYSVENCRWVSQYEQNLNCSRNRLVKYKGETMPLKRLTDKLGLKYEKVRKRLNRGWTIEKSVETP